MKKKILFSVGMLVMALSIGACSDSDNKKEEPEWAVEKQEKTSVEEKNTSVDKEKQTKEVQTKENNGIKEFDTTPTIEETVIYDKDSVKITATELSYTGNSAELSLTIENNRDKNLSFYSGNAIYSRSAINGFMLEGGYLNASVTAGNKAMETVSFDKNELMLYGITQISDIYVGIMISDDEYNQEFLETNQIKTSVFETYDYEKDSYIQNMKDKSVESIYNCTVDYFAEDVLYNEGNVSIISEAEVTNKDGDIGVLLEAKNDLQDLVWVEISNVSINGIKIKSNSASKTLVNPSAKKVININLSSILDKTGLETLNMSKINTFDFSFSVYDFEGNNLNNPSVVNLKISENKNSDVTGDELYNENGVRILLNGVKDSTNNYSTYIYFTVENNTQEEIKATRGTDTLAVNKIMTDYIMDDQKLMPGEKGILVVQMDSSSLEENKINGVEDITSIEFSLKIEDNKYNIIAEPKLSITKQ